MGGAGLAAATTTAPGSRGWGAGEGASFGAGAVGLPRRSGRASDRLGVAAGGAAGRGGSCAGMASNSSAGERDDGDGAAPPRQHGQAYLWTKCSMTNNDAGQYSS